MHTKVKIQEWRRIKKRDDQFHEAFPLPNNFNEFHSGTIIQEFIMNTDLDHDSSFPDKKYNEFLTFFKFAPLRINIFRRL
jgi:hypothetical protein